MCLTVVSSSCGRAIDCKSIGVGSNPITPLYMPSALMVGAKEGCRGWEVGKNKFIKWSQ